MYRLSYSFLDTRELDLQFDNNEGTLQPSIHPAAFSNIRAALFHLLPRMERVDPTNIINIHNIGKEITVPTNPTHSFTKFNV